MYIFFLNKWKEEFDNFVRDWKGENHGYAFMNRYGRGLKGGKYIKARNKLRNVCLYLKRVLTDLLPIQ